MAVLAAREGYARCVRQRPRAGDVPFEPAAVAPGTQHSHALFPVSTGDTLANHTGSWSLDRPVIGADCTACAVCALFCPEGAIIRRPDGSMAVGLFNVGDDTIPISTTWAELKLSGPRPARGYPVRDLWRQKDLGIQADGFSAAIPRHGCMLIRVSPTK